MAQRMLAPLVACLGLALAFPAAGAETTRLPIAEGVWVKAEDTCAAATNVFVHLAGRFGSVYFYGPNYSLGPADETEAVARSGAAADGFTMVNEGPIEVIALPNGRAQVRAVSRSEGVAWTEDVRLCPTAALSPRLRQGLARLRLLPG